jgi:two-component system response regulator TctD
MKILCADDNEWIAELYQHILAKLGHEVRSVSDGQAAWDLLAADLGAFDLVFLDYQMPKLNGLELVSRLKRAGYRGRVVVQSGFLTPDGESALKALNVDRILHKPFGLAEVLQIMSELFPG